MDVQARRQKAKWTIKMLGLWMMATVVNASGFQPVFDMQCEGAKFVADARPFNHNEAGSSQVALRYRYKGVLLDAVRYEVY